MPSLREQLRAYARALDDASTASALDQARGTSSAPHLDPRPARPRRPWFLAAAVVVVVALVGGAIAWRAAGRDGEDDLTTTGTAGGPADELGWRRLADTGPDDAPDDNGFLATIEVAEWTGETLYVVANRDPMTGDWLDQLAVHAWDRDDDAWDRLPPPGLSVREDVLHAWTGEEVLLWGGVRYPSIAEVPLDPSDRDGPDPEVFTDGVAYDPDSGDWRPLPTPPLPGGDEYASTWTGEEWVVWGGPQGTRNWDDPALAAAGFVTGGLVSQQGAAYDPEADAWRPLPPAPVDLVSVDAGWNGQEVVIWGPRFEGDPNAETQLQVAAWNPETDRWRELPAPDIDPRALGVLTDDGFVLVAEDGARLWDDATARWRQLPSPPAFDCSEDPTTLLPFEGTALLVPACANDAFLLDLAAPRWRPVADTPRMPWRAWGGPGLDSAVVRAGQWETSALWLLAR